MDKGKVLRVDTERMEELMRQQKKTRTWWGENSELTRQGISYILDTGRSTLDRISYIAGVLGVPPKSLLTEEERELQDEREVE